MQTSSTIISYRDGKDNPIWAVELDEPDESADTIGWRPIDSADPFAGQLGGKVSDSPVEERYMGGEFCARDYSRPAPAPQKLFD